LEKIGSIAEGSQSDVLKGFSEKFNKELFNPQNIGRIDAPDSYARVTGVCGDTIEMYLSIKAGKIIDVRFLTSGCGATIACSSYATRMIRGKSIKNAFSIKPKDIDNYFEGLPIQYKHCAKLAVITLKAALKEYARRQI
jgi:nitrogen fixation NifU-like protein